MANWEAIGAMGGALAGAVGALAAWRAASASSRTSRDAVRALASAIRPRLIASLIWLPGGGPGSNSVRVENQSDWDALDVDVEARFRDGQRLTESVSRLRGRDASLTVAHVEVLAIPDDPVRHLYFDLQSIRVRYWDSRHLSRYETRVTFFIQDRPDHPDGPLTGWERSEEQIEGP